MKNIFDKVFEITADKSLELRHEFKEQINKELALGMTRYVCRYGTLGDGFEKLTASQRYYQAVKECWIRSNELVRLRANAKSAYADYLDAKKELAAAWDDSAKLRAEAKIELSELSAIELTVATEDTYRQFDEFNKVRMELMNEVRTKYPNGIEQAEPDNWSAVMRYRLMRGDRDLQSIPLPIDEKARIGRDIGAMNPTAAQALVAGRAADDMGFALELMDTTKGALDG